MSAQIACQWFDRDSVDMVTDVPTIACGVPGVALPAESAVDASTGLIGWVKPGPWQITTPV